MTLKERDAFTARWLSVLNSADAGSSKNKRVIIDALAKAHGMRVDNSARPGHLSGVGRLREQPPRSSR